MVSSSPRPHFTPGKDTVPILQEAVWGPGPVWTDGKSRPHRDSIPNRPARSQSLCRLCYPAQSYVVLTPEIDTVSIRTYTLYTMSLFSNLIFFVFLSFCFPFFLLLLLPQSYSLIPVFLPTLYFWPG